MRCGVIARKIGMTHIYSDTGRQVPVTVLQLENCQIIGQRVQGTHGYTALQLGAGEAKPHRMTRPQRGVFGKAGVAPKKKVAEFRVSPDNLIEIGAELTATHFVSGQHVDVSARSIGKGFAGGIKRHNFGGLRASHGVSISHRSIGSTGQCQDPGKVFKGKKMPGQMGNVRVTTQNLRVVRTDAQRDLILIEGSVPGARGGWVFIRDALKRALPEDAPRPGAFRPAEALQSASSGAGNAADDGQSSPGAGPDAGQGTAQAGGEGAHGAGKKERGDEA